MRVRDCQQRLQEKRNERVIRYLGRHLVSMEASAPGAKLEFDCAHGAILQPIKPDAKGGFTVRGTCLTPAGNRGLRTEPDDECTRRTLIVARSAALIHRRYRDFARDRSSQ